MKKLSIFIIISSLMSADFNETKTDINNTINLEKNETNSTNLTTNVNFVKFDNFNNAFFRLPISAKAIEEVVVKFYNSNGKLEEKIIKINKKINPNDEFIIGVNPKPQTPQILDVSVTANEKIQKPIAVKEPKFPAMILKYDNNTKLSVEKDKLIIITKDILKSSRMDIFNRSFSVSFFGEGEGNKSFVINKAGFKDANITTDTTGIYNIKFLDLEGNYTTKKVSDGYEVIKAD